MELIYETEFSLTRPVKDIVSANKYLAEDDMSEYLLADLPELKGAVTAIEWSLVDAQRGVIRLITNQEIQTSVLTEVSEWIKNQNSDGLGEGFKQRDFACYSYDKGFPISDTTSLTQSELLRDSFIICSFKPEKDNYELKLVKKVN